MDLFTWHSKICDAYRCVAKRRYWKQESLEHVLFSATICKNYTFPFWVPTPLPQILISNPFINWSGLRAKAKNGSFTRCLHISLCCINNASKSESHKSHIATGWQNRAADTRDWAPELDSVKAEQGLIQSKSPHNSSGKLSYWKRRGTESACLCCCTEKKDCTIPFCHSWCWKRLGITDCREKEIREVQSSYIFGHSSGFAHS